MNPHELFFLFIYFSLSEVHPKKVRKVPPGLPSSVSDNMLFVKWFFLVFPRYHRRFECVCVCLCVCVCVCVSEGKRAADAPACLNWLSWFL